MTFLYMSYFLYIKQFFTNCIIFCGWSQTQRWSRVAASHSGCRLAPYSVSSADTYYYLRTCFSASWISLRRRSRSAALHGCWLLGVFTRAVATRSAVALVGVLVSAAVDVSNASSTWRHYVNPSYAHEQHKRTHRKQNQTADNDANLRRKRKSHKNGSQMVGTKFTRYYFVWLID